MGSGAGKTRRAQTAFGSPGSTREPIEPTDSVKDVVVKMSDGNMGAINVLMRIIEGDPDEGVLDILHLNDMNMRGSQIWVGYKDYCGESLSRFLECVRAHDPAMVAKVNEQCGHSGEVAIAGGNAYIPARDPGPFPKAKVVDF